MKISQEYSKFISNFSKTLVLVTVGVSLFSFAVQVTMIMEEILQLSTIGVFLNWMASLMLFVFFPVCTFILVFTNSEDLEDLYKWQIKIHDDVVDTYNLLEEKEKSNQDEENV